MTTVAEPLVRDDLHDVDDHIRAMCAARTASEALSVLESAQRRHLGGQYVRCLRHDTAPMTFAQLLQHTATDLHEAFEIDPADADPIEARRFGGDR